MIARRKFLIGLGSMLAAPAIVHAGNLMPIKALPLTREQMIAEMLSQTTEYLEGMSQNIAHTIIYGNPKFMALQITGFESFYGSDNVQELYA